MALRFKRYKKGGIEYHSMRLYRTKKGVTPWISWLILTVFVISLGGFVSLWMKEQVTDSVDNAKRAIYNSEDCEKLAIDIREAVLKNSQTLNMKVINTYDVRVDQLAFTLYDANNGILNASAINITIRPNENKTVEIGTNQTIAFVKVIPVYFRDKGRDDLIRVVCSENAVEKNMTA